MKVRVKKGGELTPQELAAQNQFAKDFAARKGLLIAPDAHVGKMGANFVDPSGNVLSPQVQPKLPVNTIMDIRHIPSYVQALSMDDNNVPYFIDQSTGDIQYVHPDIARSSRFNPNRGKSVDMLIAKK